MTAVTASRIFWPVSPPQQTRLAAATLILVLVTVTGLLFDFFTGSRFPYLMLVAVVLLTAWYGGRRAGVFATVLGVLCSLAVGFVKGFGPVTPVDRAFWQGLIFFALEGGFISYIVGLLRETQLQHEEANQMIRESQRALKTLLDNLPGMVYRCANDPDWTMLYASPGTQAVTGYNEKEVEMNRAVAYGDLILPEDRPAVWHAVQDALDHQKPYQLMYRIRTKDQNTKWVWEKGIGVFSEKGQLQVLEGFICDVTEIKKTEEALKKAKIEAENANITKTQFLANMSHEMRTPLGVIIGYTDLAMEKDTSAEERLESLGKIRANASQLLELINDILDLSRVEADKLVVEPRKISPRALLENVVSVMSLAAREKNIELNLSIAEDVPQTIHTDPLRLRQILTNIIGNAIKFTQSGSVTVRAHVPSVADDQHALLTLTVIDTGIGISYENQQKLFQPFSQADATMSRKYGGSGLGLALARRLALSLGGDIILKDSSPERGSVFEVTIDPQLPCSAETKEERPEEHFVEQTLTSEIPLRVLVVDDSSDNQFLMKHMLARFGAEVETADNGLQGIQKALESEYNLILMDIQMPIMDGYTAVKDLRSQGYGAPVIAVTAHAMKGEQEKCLQAGFNDYVAKPLTSQVLKETISRVLRRNLLTAAPAPV